MYPWVVLTITTPKNHITTIFASSEHLLSTCMEMRDSKKKHPKKGYPSNFQGVHMTDPPKVEEMLQLNFFLYDIDFVHGELIGELARRSIQKFKKSVKLLRYNKQICYVRDINSFFKSFRCSTCDTIFQRLETWSDI